MWEPFVPMSSIASERVRIETCDPRSDNRRRIVDIGREAVTIRRAVAGISMSIRVVARDFRGVVLRATDLDQGAFRYEVRLLHRDPDLSVVLAEGEDRAAADREWRGWVRFLRLPALVGRREGRDVEINIDATDIRLRIPHERRQGRALNARRPRFLMRRKTPSREPEPIVDRDPVVLVFWPNKDR